MGKQCVVFNCSEGLDFKTLGRFFSGLAQSGSWCCFDEFNRIDIEVLSVVAQQLHSIKMAKDLSMARFIFEGHEIKLNPTCGIFITMNPSYAGRVDLPDNLKSLFRPVAMIVPDYGLISEVILFSEGFIMAKVLSNKIVNLYQLASKQLSQQYHYDFGMRAIKSILTIAGQKRRQLEQINGKPIDSEEEIQILIQSLFDANIPRLLAEDVLLFQNYMSDLFPKHTFSFNSFKTFERAVGLTVEEMRLQFWSNQVEKVKQLYNQLLVRHGVMLIGPTGGGKTTVRNLLQRTLVVWPSITSDNDLVKGKTRNTLKKKCQVDTFVINPKCLTLGQLFGQFDANTFAWSDGLVTVALHKFSSDSNQHLSELKTDKTPSSNINSSVTVKNQLDDVAIKSDSENSSATITDEFIAIDWKWIILDGPIDCHWVENFNTALDDSKTFCLPNGERIGLLPSMRFIFEVDDLSNASPATISRCAMVYMDPVDLGWHPFVETWITSLPIPDSSRDYLLMMFEYSIDLGLSFMRRNKQNLTWSSVSSLCYVKCVCNLLSSLMDCLESYGGLNSSTENMKETYSDTKFQRSTSSLDRSKSPRKLMRTNRPKSVVRDHLGRETFIQKNPSLLNVFLGKLYVFAFTWGIGGNLKRIDDSDFNFATAKKSQEKCTADMATEFDKFLRETFDTEPPFGVRLPPYNQTMFSYFVDIFSGNFVSWDSLIPSSSSLIDQGSLWNFNDEQAHFKSESGIDFVQTVDSVRYSFLSALLVLHKNPVLLTGDIGVGKTSIADNILRKLEMEGGMSLFNVNSVLGSVFNFSERNHNLLSRVGMLSNNPLQMHDMNLITGNDSPPKLKRGVIVSSVQLSSQTLVDRVQKALTCKLIKKTRDRLSAPKDKQVILFVDDMNMPTPEETGAQPPLEFVRQFLDLGGFYDVKNLVWKDVSDVNIMAACGQPESGRNHISPRLLKHFCILSLPQPSVLTLQHIYKVNLGRFFSDGEFMPDVKDSLSSVVNSAISVYQKTCAMLRPTPNKMHYTFNIRDLSKVISGVMQSDSKVLTSQTGLVLLFVHEVMRIFDDRLSNEVDHRSFRQVLLDSLQNDLKVKWNMQMLTSRPILFADFVDVSDTSDTYRPYKVVTDQVKLRKVLEELYMRKNSGNLSVAPFVFFQTAIEHILRAARVFRQPNNHMLLVGLDGTGKSSAVQLASYVAQCHLYQLNPNLKYTSSDFREDVKKVFIMAGVRGLKTVFMLNDSNIIEESFLEDVCCIVNSGEVPDLFDEDEIKSICFDLKSNVSELLTVNDSRTAVVQYFLKTVKKNLHVVFATSPVGPKFRNRCRIFPALVSCCTIDWYSEWDADAMLSVANVYFHDAEFVMTSPETNSTKIDVDKLKSNVAQVCVSIHNSVTVATKQFWQEQRRHNYITPSSYIDFLHGYSLMLKAKKDELFANKHRLLFGLDQLSEANHLVGSMQVELVDLGPKTEEKAKETETLLDQLKKDQEAVEQVREIVRSEESTMAEEKNIVLDYANDCQKDLDSVIPILKSALDSLSSLDKNDIVEIRVYTNPPDLVMMVLSAICLLLQEKSGHWNNAKQVMADPQFLKRLINIDKDSIPEKVFTKLQRYTSHPDFTPDKVGGVSKACRSMTMWVLALEHYHKVNKLAKPKQKRLEDAKEALQLAEKNLSKKQRSLKKIEGHLKVLQHHYQESVNQREFLKQRKELTALRLQRAAILIGALSAEKDRWSKSADSLEIKIKNVVGDILVSSAVVMYCGVFNSRYRNKLINRWVQLCQDGNISISNDFSFVKTLISDNQIIKWTSEDLPQDLHSLENAVILHWCWKWPLLIDPQGQASRWIKHMESTNGLKVVCTSNANYERTIETAVTVGEPVMIQELTETLESTLSQILTKNLATRGSHVMNRDDVSSTNNFRLYMTTSQSNPHYLPSVCNQTTIIDFSVTFDGLQEQLLSIVVKKEQPLLESERIELLKTIVSDLHLLQDLEDKMLSLLQTAQGQLLDHQDLVDMLQNSQKMSEEIKLRVQKSEEAENLLNQARKKYMPVATRGAIIYFVLADLHRINIMYQFSLAWFRQLFTSSIDLKRHKIGTAIDAKDDMDAHMDQMMNRVTSVVHGLVSIGLFNCHRQIFTFTLCVKILRSSEVNNSNGDHKCLITDKELLVFLQGSQLSTNFDKGLSKELTSINKLNIRPAWVTDNIWKECCNLELSVPSFLGLCRSIATCPNQWQQLRDSPNPYNTMDHKYNITNSNSTECPFPWNNLSRFHRLMLIKVVYRSALISAVHFFIREFLGEEYVAGTSNPLFRVFSESTATTPIIFILSPGSNPINQLYQFAKETRGSTIHLDIISLGKGQGSRAEEMINKSQILKGRWIFLQNCHLATSWMPRLKAVVDKFSFPSSELDQNFRMWLSSKPDPNFPSSVLQAGIKITIEQPIGVKANLLRSFTSIQGQLEETCFSGEKQVQWKNLVFGLCLFNAVLHERKKYSQLGWNVPYEFNDSDFEVSVLQLQMFLSQQQEIPWNALSYITGEVIFGGRITDEWDKRCLLSMLRKFYNPNVFLPDYSYSDDGSYCPVQTNLAYSNMVSHIEGLPVMDNSSLFGMDKYAEQAALDSQAKQFLDTILLTQPRLATSKSNDSPMRSTNDESSILELIKKIKQSVYPSVPCHDDSDELLSKVRIQLTLMEIYQMAIGTETDIVKKYRKMDEERKDKTNSCLSVVLEEIRTLSKSSLFTVLRQEVDRFNVLLTLVHSSLDQLVLAVEGDIVLSENLEETFESLINHTVPRQWRQFSFETCKSLGSWIEELIQRVKFFQSWSAQLTGAAEDLFKRITAGTLLHNIPTGKLYKTYPARFWLSAFFFPQGFLTAVLQNYARDIGASIDLLQFEYKIGDIESENQDIKLSADGSTVIEDSGKFHGVVGFGLSLDGAAWNSVDRILCDSKCGERFSNMPDIYFIPRLAPITKIQINDNKYICPLYQTSSRVSSMTSNGRTANFVTSIDLDSDKPCQHWILRGVALLCQADH